MDLKPLPNHGDVSPEEFKQLFEARLGDNWARAIRAFMLLGPMHSFSTANVIHLGLQKGNVAEVIDALEKWCEIVQRAPNPVVAGVDTKLQFDVMYGQFFMTEEDTLDGLGPFEKRDGYRTVRRTRFEKLWTP